MHPCPVLNSRCVPGFQKLSVSGEDDTAEPGRIISSEWPAEPGEMILRLPSGAFSQPVAGWPAREMNPKYSAFCDMPAQLRITHSRSMRYLESNISAVFPSSLIRMSVLYVPKVVEVKETGLGNNPPPKVGGGRLEYRGTNAYGVSELGAEVMGRISPETPFPPRLVAP